MGSKLVFLADPHLHHLGEVENAVLSLVARENPDVIVLGGDIVDKFTRDLDPVRKYLSGLEAREKLAVLGNHDYWSGWSAQLSRALKDHEFELLKDSSTRTKAGPVYGLDWRESRRYPEISKEGLVIAHDPNAALSVRGMCKMLAGHTHGGVVIGGLVLVTNSHFTRGLYELWAGPCP